MAGIVAEIPASAVGEHDSQVGRYVFSEEGCDSFIGEEVTEILLLGRRIGSFGCVYSRQCPLPHLHDCVWGVLF